MRVVVKHGTDLVEERECRSVVLPDGREGAVWRGLAFPLQNEAIDVSGEGTPPALCDRTPDPPQAFALQRTSGGVYVLLTGSVTRAQKAAADLARAGLPVVRHGRYVGESLPGFAPDWFVRLSIDAAIGLDDRISAVLGVEVQPVEATVRLRERVIAAELERAIARLDVAKDELEQRRRSASDAAALNSELAANKHLLETERARREAAEEAAAQAQARVDSLRAERPAAPSDRAIQRIADEVEDVLSVLLPRIRLLRDSLDVVATEYASRRQFYRALGDLDAKAQGYPDDWKPVRGASPWIERHLSTGRSGSGRAYARLDRGDRMWSVLVSDKSEQPRDIEWLKRQ